MKKKRKPHIFVFVLNVRKELKKKKKFWSSSNECGYSAMAVCRLHGADLACSRPRFQTLNNCLSFHRFFFLSLQTSNVLCHPSNWRKASAIATRETRPSSHVKSHTRRRFAFAFCVCASLNVFQPKVFGFEYCVSNTWDVSRTAKQNRKNKCCGCDIYQRLTMSGRTVGKKKLFLAERKAGRWQR